MPFGEVEVTLQDIEVLFGLQVDGVPGYDTCLLDEIVILCRNLLGFTTPRDGFVTNSRILGTAGSAVQTLTAHSTDLEVQQQTRRRLIFHLLGGFLFFDTTKKYYKLYLLDFLQSFQVCRQYSWGSAVLAYMYRALCRAANYDTSTVCGCILLLQIWAWEKLPMVRPQNVLSCTRMGDFPLAFRWACPHTWRSVPAHTNRAYRD